MLLEFDKLKFKIKSAFLIKERIIKNLQHWVQAFIQNNQMK